MATNTLYIAQHSGGQRQWYHPHISDIRTSPFCMVTVILQTLMRSSSQNTFLIKLISRVIYIHLRSCPFLIQALRSVRHTGLSTWLRMIHGVHRTRWISICILPARILRMTPSQYPMQFFRPMPTWMPSTGCSNREVTITATCLISRVKMSTRILNSRTHI